MNASGDAVAVWLVSAATPVTSSAVQATSRPATGAFAPAEDLSGQRSASLAFPAATITGDGRALVAFSGDDGMVRIRSRPGAGPGARRSCSGARPSPTEGCRASRRGGGHAAVAWPVAACSALIARADPAGTWGAPAALAPGSSCVERPVLAVDAAGAVDAAWSGWDGYVRRLMVAAAPLGGSFGAAVNPGPASVSILQPNVVRSLAGGDVLVGWTGPAYRPVIARRTAGAWETGRAAPTVAGFGVAAIALGADGTAVAVTSAGTGGSPLGSVAAPHGAWSAPQPVTTPGPAGPVRPSIQRRRHRGRGRHDHHPGVGVHRAAPCAPRRRRPRPRAPHGTLPLSARRTCHAHAHAVRSRPLRADRGAAPERHRLDDASPYDLGRARAGADHRPGPVVPARRVPPASGGGCCSCTERARTVRVTRPARIRIPLPGSAQTIAAGPQGIWLLGTDDPSSPGRATLRRLDPATGRVTARTAFDVAGQSRAPGALAVGAGAVWVPTADGVVRVDARSGVPTLTALPSGARSVTAEGSRVWVGGVCDPSPEPIIELCRSRRAVSLDATTGAPTGRQVSLQPKGSADTVKLVGRTLWLYGEVTDNYDNSVLASADPETAALTSGPREYGGRFGVPFAALDATHVWILRRDVTEVRPKERALSAVSPGFRPRQAVRDGRNAWLLERSPVPSRGGTTRERLVRINLVTGKRTGRIVELGATNDRATMFTIAGGVAWVLRPDEGALLRVRLDRPGRL